MTEPQIDVLYSEEEIAARIDDLAGEIARTGFENLLVVAVLKGSFMFAADLLRAMHRTGMAPEIEFLQLRSYGAGTTSSGRIEVLRDIDTDVAGRDILIVDDILESGRTLAFARDRLLERGARRVAIVALLDKPGKRAVDINADFVGFDCPDRFIFGFGIDMGHAYRQLPYIGALREPPAAAAGPGKAGEGER
ncbi:hypoxanthine phosphoribosyltransferase [Rhodobium orientis]|uniref:Hypoxanthine phosphoribosyltransferase n=1 Tax=Rhodobium orientis TaxID=34017 RepID=A0A327JFH0_9HYPH|nr:hypoxanthine phosphoribosyltransferase [Rhodobium orientis]MBB4303584.1 hypoxanthine phosphoribosyltransferase [Rhodobium orientis]MBK5951959.1 hypoxanthine phosphoribosyltransferase [Rhodobium orientis]RAI24865.1 hypoxanthine phosphoribosyltransferase [Rhodobium orientis]